MKNRRARNLVQPTLLKLLTIASFFSVPLLTPAAPGDLDPTFGVGGKVIDRFITGGGNDNGRSVLIQADGKIVTVGHSSYGDLTVCSATRHLAGGALDQSFGTGGKVLLDLAFPMSCFSAALQSDGKIVAAGVSFTNPNQTNPNQNGDIALVRFNSDGSLDTTFDGDGIATTHAGDHSAAFAVAIQTDGKIVATGLSINGTANFALVRYYPDGSRDTTFDGDGIVTTPIDVGSRAFSVDIQPDGKIVAAGNSYNGTNSAFPLVRYNSDGSLDTSFDGDGKVITALGTFDDYANSVAIRSDGKIVAAGNSFNGSGYNFALVRYSMDGSLDTSFDGDGKVTTSIGISSGANAVALQQDGKIVAAGFNNYGSTSEFTLIRYKTDGSLDASFSGDGIAMTRISSFGDYCSSVALQADGRMVAAGSTNFNGIDDDFVLVRYNTDGSLDTSFDVDGILMTDNGHGSIYGIDVAIQPDGKIVAVGTGTAPIVVARYNIDGSSDMTFGGTGKVLIDRYRFAGDVAIQPDGKILVVGRGNDDKYALGELLRLNSDGSLDTSFGTNGIVTPLFIPSIAAALPDGKILIVEGSILFRLNANGSFDSTFSQCSGGGAYSYLYHRIEGVIQPDGKILTVFPSSNGTHNFGVYRCNINGGLDTTFGSGGVVITPMSEAAAQSIAIDTDGKIVVAGQNQSSGGTDWKPTLVRYNPNGSLDTGFGTGGIVTAPTTGETDLPFTDVVIQADGKIVASSTFGSAFALFRYDPNGSLDTTFGGGDGISTVDFNNSYGSGNGMALDSQGRAVVVTSSNGHLALTRFLLHSAKYDFDGDGRADVSVFRPSDRTWYLNQSTNGFASTQWGFPTDRITPADYDGDSKTDISVYRDGTWYWLASSNNSYNTINFGLASDIPVPADFTGDGRAEIAIYRDGTWWIKDLTTNQTQIVNFGLSTDKPVVADYDGDGRADQAVYRNGEWHVNRSTTGYTVMNFGLATDRPVVADYDGDGRADLAVYRDGVWYLQQTTDGFRAFNWGLASDIPTPGDYDGDGKADAAVYRNGTWYLNQSSSGFSIQQFGLAGDKPAPAAYLP